MDVISKNLFRDMLNAKNFELSSEIARKAEPFILKEGIMYIMGQDNRLCKCLTTSKAQIVLKELHEGVIGRHFVANITSKKILDARYWCQTLFKDTHELCKNYHSC